MPANNREVAEFCGTVRPSPVTRLEADSAPPRTNRDLVRFRGEFLESGFHGESFIDATLPRLGWIKRGTKVPITGAFDALGGPVRADPDRSPVRRLAMRRQGMITT
jgi:hypothetical protein